MHALFCTLLCGFGKEKLLKSVKIYLIELLMAWYDEVSLAPCVPGGIKGTKKCM